MYITLTLKYRPSSFKEVIGQEHVTTALMGSLQSKQIHHAYLFSGPRGCGKTSSARILARSLNCAEGPTDDPCGECQSCKDLVANGPGSLDVIEMDAATHGLVDDARELRDKALYAPVQSRYKIYIIDEAHQLGPAAANALLKVVEEPPPYVIFVFATTEPEKVLPTIRSRTHHYQFRLVSTEILVNHMNTVLKKESIELPISVVELAAKIGAGSVRDSLSTLGQFISASNEPGFDYEAATRLVGQTGSLELSRIFESLLDEDIAPAIAMVESVISQGSDSRRFVQDLLERVRDMTLLLAGSSDGVKTLRSYKPEVLQGIEVAAQKAGINRLIFWSEVLADHLIKLRASLPPQVTLEMMFVRMMVEPSVSKSTSGPTIDPGIKASTERAGSRLSKPEVNQSHQTTMKRPLNTVGSLQEIENVWPQIMENVKVARRLTWTLLSTGVTLEKFEDGVLTLAFVNAGAAESFTRSESAEIFQVAVSRVFSGVKQIAITVGGIPPIQKFDNEMVNEEESENALSGENLLMRELGATVISTDER
jgi:DNA polymerase-3 subunit gamma/tau